METKTMFDGLEEFDARRYEDEARERWGGGEAWKESMKRTRNYAQEDWTGVRKEGEAIVAALAALQAKGAHAADRAATELAEAHRRHIDRWFYPCSHAMHRGLARMYTADPRFEEYFEKRGEGLAAFVQDAIRANEAKRRARARASGSAAGGAAS